MNASRLLVAALLLATACSRSEPVYQAELPDAAVEQPPAPPVAAVTTLAPAPGPFNGSVTVTLTTDKPATLSVTTDGSDPRSSSSARSMPSPASITLDATTTLTFFSRTPEDAEEAVRSAEYVRAGGPKGTISGVVVVGEVAAGNPVLIDADGESHEVSPAADSGELPFTIEGLGSGTHSLMAFADRNGDGISLPYVDLQSDTVEVALDLSDPFAASVEGVKLYLAQSQPQLCTIKGNVVFTGPVPGQTLTVAALDPSLLAQGADPSSLLGQLQNGYKVVTNETDTVYPFVITDLEPGSYLVVPALAGVGGGIALNLIVSPLGQKSLSAGDVATVDFAFGAVSISGSATLAPTSSSPFAWGTVAARSVSVMSMSIQAVLMPTIYLPSEAGPRGSFSGQALRENERFDLRAFSNLDSNNPFTSALTWVLNPFAAEPPQATVTSTPPNVSIDFSATQSPP